MVLAFSDRIPRVPSYSGYSLLLNNFNYRAFTVFGCAFQHSSSIVILGLRSPLPHRYCYLWFGLFQFRSPLLSESFVYFLFLWVIRCFSSPGSLCITIYSLYNTITLLMVSSLIRISTDLCSFATPRSFSQLVTSFFGAMCQGILLYALCSLIFLSFAFFSNPSNLLSSLTYTRLYYFVNRSYVLFFFRINLFI